MIPFIFFLSFAYASPLILYPTEMNNSQPFFETKSNQLSPNAEEVFLTVPAGHEFLISTFITAEAYAQYCRLFVDGNIVLEPPGLHMSETGSHTTSPSQSAFIAGLGTHKVIEGQTITVKNTFHNATCSYFVQGRYVEPGSPYFTFSGDSGTQPTVFTTNPTQTALIKLAMTNTSNCNLIVNGTITVHGRSDAMLVGNSTQTALKNGNGLILVEPNSTVSMSPTCTYYIAGVWLE